MATSLYACLFVRLSLCMFVFLSVYNFICLFVRLSVCLLESPIVYCVAYVRLIDPMVNLNLQATKLFIVTSATKVGMVTTPLRFRVRFKILYRVTQPLIQHCLLHKTVYFNIIYVIATRNYDFFTTGIFP